MKVTTLPIRQIRIGERARQDLGDLTMLVDSIRDRGLLQPIVVRPDGDGYTLVAGGRRIEAHHLLGHDQIPAHIAESLADELEALHAEDDENTCRKNFTPTEAVRHADRVRSVLQSQAKERMAAAGRKAAPNRPAATERVGNLPTLFLEPETAEEAPAASDSESIATPKTRVRDQEARGSGLSGRTLEKARHVVQAARDPEAPAPVRAAALEAQRVMDRTGKIDPAFKKVVQAETAVLTAPVAEYLEASGGADELRLLKWRAAFQKELAKGFGLMGMFRPEQVASSADEDGMNELRTMAARLTTYVEQIDSLRERPAGLSLIVGG